MLYALNEYAYYAGGPLRELARTTRDAWSSTANPMAHTDLGRKIFAASDLYANVTRRYGKPEWRIDQTLVNGVPVRVRQVTAWSSPWVDMIHFSRDGADLRLAGKRKIDPAVLIVAPLSGHYATLLRGTVEAFLPDHDVYVTDWTNARNVPVLEGRFDFYDYLDHVRSRRRAARPPSPMSRPRCAPPPRFP